MGPSPEVTRRRRRIAAVACLLAAIFALSALSAATSAGGSNAVRAAIGASGKEAAEAAGAAARRLTVAASGDLLIHGPVFERARALARGRGYDFRPMFRYVKP